MGGETDPRLLLLDIADNVLVTMTRLVAGEPLIIEGERLTLATDLGLGHKIARRAIVVGEPIVKYGAPIGVATARITPGAHVHVHNVRSAYTPTYHLEDVRVAATAGGSG
jgi:altronate dehydratase small subunit